MTSARTLRGSLAGVRVGLLADASPEVSSLEEALLHEGAFIERLHPDASWWPQETGVDLVIVRVGRPMAGPHPARSAERRQLELFQTLAYTERVIALLDEPLGGELATLCEFVLPPFRASEVIPRIFRVLREPHPSASIRVGNAELNIANRTLAIEGEPVDLTFAEFEIFRALLAASGGVLSREDLHRRLGGDDGGLRSRRIDIHIHRLRAKLRRMRGASLDTVRNVGYRLTVARLG